MPKDAAARQATRSRPAAERRVSGPRRSVEAGLRLRGERSVARAASICPRAPPPYDAVISPTEQPQDGGTYASCYHDPEQVNEVGQARLPVGVVPAATGAR